MTDHIATLEELANDWDNRISAKRHDDYHDGMRGAYESAAEELRDAIALMRGQSDADKVLRTVWSILGPLPAPSCSGCAAEQTMALEAMRDYFGSNEYPTPPKDTADEQ